MMFTFAASAPLSAPRSIIRAPVCTRVHLNRSATSTRSRMSVSTAPSMTKPEQVVLSPLPRVFVYDHCPYATRTRYCLGVKNVKHQVTWLLNDDIESPTALVGKKVVPIFQPSGPDGPSMPESMDICKAVDSDARYGPPNLFRPASGRTDIAGWFNEHAELIRRLSRPRVVKAYLPEFASSDARAAYIRNHPISEPSDYEENFRNSDNLVLKLQPYMPDLDDMIFSTEFVTEGGLSFDDIDLFPRLRTLTLVADLVMPPKMEMYLSIQSAISDVGLYHVFAT